MTALNKTIPKVQLYVYNKYRETEIKRETDRDKEEDKGGCNSNNRDKNDSIK